jgi:phosphoribosylanthranilate isomerase
MARTRVKICGVTRPEDAAAACRLGADAIGIILHPASGRNVPPDRARQIIAVLTPFVTPVGVFVDAPIQQILDTAAALGLRTVQLNGEQSPEQVAELEGLAVIKAIRVTRGKLQSLLNSWRDAHLPNLIGLVMEPGGTKHAGGTGVVNDWDEIVSAQQSGAFERLPVIAAGGLNPENVAGVVRRVRPFAVDVSSGVESSIGVKSEQKIAAFIAAVREADQSL